ncbi:MAG TPA: SDR family NAD(P)-dependent oxidoreductase [Chloroflexota bacterium]|nr:SDR family NAD(P)-dependent oxidoreductase [Chloroflexota bacterium]
MSGRLNGKIALITGAGRGIGLAIARAFAQEGALLSLCGRDRSTIEREAASLEGQPLVMSCDVRDPEQVAALVAATVAQYERLDVLVANAGVGSVVPTEDMSLDEWRRVVDTNLTGAFLCAQAAGRVMLRQGSGCIILLASLTSTIGLPSRTAYGASKAGVLGLAHALAVEWGPRGVRVNALAPGFIRTDLQDDLVRRGVFPRDRVVARTPLRRIGAVEDVAAAAVYMASDEASFMNGSTLTVDGGWLANGWVE